MASISQLFVWLKYHKILISYYMVQILAFSASFLLWCPGSLRKAGRLDDEAGDHVWVAVAGGAPVLHIAVTLLGHLPWDPDAGASVGHAGGELVHGGRLVEAGQPPLVVLGCLGL